MSKISAACGGMLLLVLAASLSANVVVPAEFREVITESTLIVRGLVTDVRPVEVPGRGIDSMVTVAVESTVKGAPGPFVTVRVPGGEIDRRRFVMVGAPVFTAGERAVFFLKRDPDGWLRPIGLTMGVFRVHADARTGLPVVAAPVVARVNTAPGRVARGTIERRSMPVGEFESLVTLVNTRRVAVPRGGGSR